MVVGFGKFGGLGVCGTTFAAVDINVQFVHHFVFPLLEDFEVAARGLVFQCSLGEVEGSVVKIFPERRKARMEGASFTLGAELQTAIPRARLAGRMEASATHMMGCLPGMLQTTNLGSSRISVKPCMSGRRDMTRLRVRFGLRPLSLALSVAPLRVACPAGPAVHFTDQFDATQQEQWQTSRHLVEELGFSADDSNGILAQSFGWSYSEFWGEEKQATVPDPDGLSASLSLMKSLGLDVAALVKKFPEVIGLSEQELQYSLGTLDGTWGISGKNLKNVLMRNPQVLGYNIDCGGDCAGQCTRCWVRF